MLAAINLIFKKFSLNQNQFKKKSPSHSTIFLKTKYILAFDSDLLLVHHFGSLNLDPLCRTQLLSSVRSCICENSRRGEGNSSCIPVWIRCHKLLSRGHGPLLFMVMFYICMCWGLDHMTEPSFDISVYMLQLVRARFKLHSAVLLICIFSS